MATIRKKPTPAATVKISARFGIAGTCPAKTERSGSAMVLQSLPILSRGKEWLPTLPGMPPTLIHPPKGDAFAERNAYAMRIDYEKEPPVFQVTDTHYAATWLLDERAPKVKAPIGERRYGK